MEKAELVIAALQERIGNLVASYETQIAFLRAEITELVNRENEKNKLKNDYSKELDSKMQEVENG
jgi:hypothetical protein